MIQRRPSIFITYNILNMKFFGILLTLLLVACGSDDNGSSGPAIPPVPDFLGEVERIATYGGTKNEEARSVISTLDGGYAILGTTRSIDGDVTGNLAENNDFWLLKFDAEDNLQWNKTYGGSGIEQGQKVIQNPDGSYILVGYTSSDDEDVSRNAGLKDMWIVHVGPSGSIIWERTFGFSGDDESFSVISTSDGGYFLTGYLDVTASEGEGDDGFRSTSHGVGDFWGLKLDAQGEYVWRRYYGGTNNDRANDVIQTSDGGFIIAGSTESTDFDVTNNKGSYDYWVVRIDNTGTLLWERTLGGDQLDNGFGLVEAEDGNFIVVGNTRSSNSDVTTSLGFEDAWLVKMTIDNHVLWKKSYGGTSFDSARGIGKTSDGNFVIAGFSRSVDINLENNFGQNDAWVFKINTEGEVLFQKSIGGTGEDRGNAVAGLANDKIILVGETNSSDNDILNNQGLTDIFVVKFK